MNEKQKDYLRESILLLADNFLGSEYNLEDEQIAEIYTVISEKLYSLDTHLTTNPKNHSKNIYNSELYSMLSENIDLYASNTQNGYDMNDEFDNLILRLQGGIKDMVSSHSLSPVFNIEEDYSISFRMELFDEQVQTAKMDEKQKEYLQKAIFNLTDYFNGANYDLAQNQIDELYEIVSEPIFGLEPSKVTMSDKHTMSVFDSELFEVLDENINLFQEKVQDGKSENVEFEKLVATLKNRMEALVLNHEKTPIFNIDEESKISFSRKMDSEYIQESIMKKLVEASPEHGGLGVSPPQTAKELSENPYIDLKDLVRNIASNYIDKGAEHTLDTIRLYQLSYKQREEGYALELLVKISEFIVSLNPNLSDYRIRKTEAQLTQQEKDLNQSISNYIRSQSEDELRDYVKEAKNEFFYESDFNTDEEKQEFILDNTILGQRKATTNSDDLLELAIRSYVNTKSRQQLEDLVREYKDTFFYESEFNTTEVKEEFIKQYGAKDSLESTTNIIEYNHTPQPTKEKKMTKKYIVDNEALINWYFDSEDKEELIELAQNIVGGYGDANAMGRTVAESREREENPPTIYEELIYSNGDKESLSKAIFENLDYFPLSVLDPDMSHLPKDVDGYFEIDPEECILKTSLMSFDVYDDDDEFLEQVDDCQSPEDAISWYNNYGEGDVDAVSAKVNDDIGEPARIDMQVNFKSWLNSVGYTASPERLEQLYTDSNQEVKSMKDVLYTKFEMENGSSMDYDELQEKAFNLFKELYPKDVIYPKLYAPKDDFKFEAKITQTLSFIGNGTIMLTGDQVTNPDQPDQFEVMNLLFKIKSEKELSSFIKSTTVDTHEFSKQGVDELLDSLKPKANPSTRKTTKPMNMD